MQQIEFILVILELMLIFALIIMMLLLIQISGFFEKQKSTEAKREEVQESDIN